MLNRVYGDAKALFVKTDVTIAEDVEKAVRLAVETGGRLDM